MYIHSKQKLDQLKNSLLEWLNNLSYKKSDLLVDKQHLLGIYFDFDDFIKTNLFSLEALNKVDYNQIKQLLKENKINDIEILLDDFKEHTQFDWVMTNFDKSIDYLNKTNFSNENNLFITNQFSGKFWEYPSKHKKLEDFVLKIIPNIELEFVWIKDYENEIDQIYEIGAKTRDLEIKR